MEKDSASSNAVRPRIAGKCGCLFGPPLKNEPSMVKMASIMEAVPPETLKRDDVNPRPKMFYNDQYGNCTSAGLANAILAVTALYGMTIAIPEPLAVQFYSESTGFNPADLSTDQGGYEPQVLQYALTNGYPTKNYRFRPLWGTVPLLNRRAMANVINMLGVAYIGVSLLQMDEDAVANHTNWVLDPKGRTTPIGGHCVLLFGYTGLGDKDFVKVITWGGIMYATWEWLDRRMDECHALAWHQLMPPSKQNQLGQDWDTLVSLNRRFLNG